MVQQAGVSVIHAVAIMHHRAAGWGNGMNIAIAGAGIAGGYLARLLGQKGISPDIYDGMDHDTRCHCRSCGWGVPRCIEPYLTEVGLDFNDYLLESMPSMNFDDLVATTPLCTLDKPRLIRDFTKDIEVKKRNLSPEEAVEYDVVVDATGIARALLPPCRSDLTLPTLQQRVAVEPLGSERLGAGVYGNCIPGLGTCGSFPLVTIFTISESGVLVLPGSILSWTGFTATCRRIFLSLPSASLPRICPGCIPVLFDAIFCHKNQKRRFLLR